MANILQLIKEDLNKSDKPNLIVAIPYPDDKNTILSTLNEHINNDEIVGYTHVADDFSDIKVNHILKHPTESSDDFNRRANHHIVTYKHNGIDQDDFQNANMSAPVSDLIEYNHSGESSYKEGLQTDINTNHSNFHRLLVRSYSSDNNLVHSSVKDWMGENEGVHATTSHDNDKHRVLHYLIPHYKSETEEFNDMHKAINSSDKPTLDDMLYHHSHIVTNGLTFNKNLDSDHISTLLRHPAPFVRVATLAHQINKFTPEHHNTVATDPEINRL